MRYLILFLLATINAPGYSGSLSKQEINSINLKVKILNLAYRKGDFSVPFDLFPDQYIKHFKLVKQTTVVKGQALYKKLIEDYGMKLISLKYGQPDISYQCKKSKITFVPLKLVMKVAGKTAMSTGFLIASKNHNQKTWRFLNASRPRSRKTSFFSLIYGCQGIKVKTPPFSVKKL